MTLWWSIRAPSSKNNIGISLDTHFPKVVMKKAAKKLKSSFPLIKNVASYAFMKRKLGLPPP